MNVRFLIIVFRLFPGLKMSFEHNSIRKNLFLKACYCWDFDLSLHKGNENLNLLNSLVMQILTWTLHFVTRKCLDYMQYYMMLLEHCGHIVVKDLATVT